MLYAILAPRFVSGVFERERDARDYLQEIPEAAREQHTLTQHLLNYPIYLVEGRAGFRFLTEAEAIEDIRAHAPTEDEDDCCLTLYRIDKDYRPQVAGEDAMGLINHQHVDNEVLRLVQRDGRAGLWLVMEASS